MSFFGFDATGAKEPKGGSRMKKGKPLDFEETYRGLGDYGVEEDDYLNDETFGGEVEFGTDFDFGHGGAQSGSGTVGGAAPAQNYVGSRSYAAAAAAAANQPSLDANMEMKPMESLWVSQQAQPQQQQPAMQQQQEVLSMEELEKQQRQMQQQQQQQGYMQNFGQQPQFAGQYAGGFPPQGMRDGQQFQQMPSQMFGQQMPPQMFNQEVPVGYNPQQVNVQVPPQMQHLQQQHMQPHHLQQQQQQQMQQQHRYMQPQQPMVQEPAQMVNKAPVFSNENMAGSMEYQNRDAMVSPGTEYVQPHMAQQQHQQQHQGPADQQHQTFQLLQRDNSGQNSRDSGRRMSRRNEPLAPEEQKRLQVRQAKVEKILKNAGLMTPRDKDFITRYQLSQIVTEDPYNEDFYFQVYKIIQSGGVAGKSNKDLIARAYLEHSGHRLGGRYKRADVALQRMQNQVEKAVTVAKERPQKNKDNIDAAREGVLGKISSTLNSKAPRRQLQIPSPRSGDEDEEILSSDKFSNSSTPALEEVTDSLKNVEINKAAKSRRRSSYAFSSVDQSSVLSRSGGKKFVLSLIEEVYEEVLELEAQLRSGNITDSTGLWESLHIGNENFEVCPFISMLSFDKGVKIMPRIFNFLNKEQKLKLLQTFFSELSHLNVVILSSFKTNTSPTEQQLKKIELFQAVFLKIIVSYLSNNANFIEIMGLLLQLISNNNVSFISTSTLGLNLITVLISRAALIKQDNSRTNSLSTADIQTWNEIYDKLFIALETKLSLVFPPSSYSDKVLSANASLSQQQAGSSQSTQYYDQAYIWQFLASLALSGKLNHQRIIIDEIRDEIFGTINTAENLAKNSAQDSSAMYRREKLYQDLNLFLNVMGLVARDGEITELK